MKPIQTFAQLLKLRGEDDSRVDMWVKRKTDKYTSGDIQNEIPKIMSTHIVRRVASAICTARFFTIMADETTDATNVEQLVICFRWVDQSLEAHEDFIGMYAIESTEASVILRSIRDILMRLNLSLSKVRGQCYVGASAMAGATGGVAAQILHEEPKAIYTHCYGHALNLACSDTVRQCSLMRSSLDIVYEIINLKKSHLVVRLLWNG